MGHNCECVKMGLAHEKKSYLQEKANLFEIGSKTKDRLPNKNGTGIKE